MINPLETVQHYPNSLSTARPMAIEYVDGIQIDKFRAFFFLHKKK